MAGTARVIRKATRSQCTSCLLSACGSTSTGPQEVPWSGRCPPGSRQSKPERRRRRLGPGACLTTAPVHSVTLGMQRPCKCMPTDHMCALTLHGTGLDPWTRAFAHCWWTFTWIHTKTAYAGVWIHISDPAQVHALQSNTCARTPQGQVYWITRTGLTCHLGAWWVRTLGQLQFELESHGNDPDLVWGGGDRGREDPGPSLDSLCKDT